MAFRFRFQFRFQFLFPGSGSGSGCAAGLHLQASRPAQPSERVLVIPFENPTREPRILWIGEASAVLLADDLNAFGKRAYTREERLDAFQRLQVPPVATLSHATVIRLGQVVGATHVVIGSFRLTGGMISVRTQNIRLDTGRMEHEFVEAGPLEDLFAIFGRVSRRLAGQSASDAPPPRPALPVFENYIKGLIATSTPAKIGYLEAAIKLDPGFDRARLALWNVQYDDANGQAALVAAAAVAETSPMYARCAVQRGAVAHPAQSPGRCVCHAENARRSRAVGDIDEQHRRHPVAAAGHAGDRPRDVLLQSGIEARRRRSGLLLQSRVRLLGREGCGVRDLLVARGCPPRSGGWRSACGARRRAAGNRRGRRGGARARARDAVVLDVRRVGEEDRLLRVARLSHAGSSGSSCRWRSPRSTESTAR